MLNSPYSPGSITSSTLPGLLTAVSTSSSYTMQTFGGGNNPQMGFPQQSQGMGFPGGSYGPQMVGMPQPSLPYGGGMQFMPPAQQYGPPMMTQPYVPPVPGRLVYQPGRIVTNYGQVVQRTFIPPRVSVVPLYPQPGSVPMGYPPRWY